MAKYIGTQPPHSDFSINGVLPDTTGNYSIDRVAIGAAPAVHTHEISSVIGLQDALDNKSNIDHVHNYVQSITVAGDTLSGNVSLSVSGDLALNASGTSISITSLAPTTAVSSAITDSADGTTQVKTFVGTQAEWDAFTPEAGIKYIAYIY